MAYLPTLTTQRLVLRPFQKDDIDAIYMIFKDKEANTFLPWFPLKSIEEAKKLYEEKYQKSKGLDYDMMTS